MKPSKQFARKAPKLVTLECASDECNETIKALPNEIPAGWREWVNPPEDRFPDGTRNLEADRMVFCPCTMIVEVPVSVADFKAEQGKDDPRLLVAVFED